MSTQTDVVDTYLEGFRRSDHEMVLDCLADDVTWHIHGHRTPPRGKAEFDDEIENDQFEGSPELTVGRVLEAGDVVVVTGEGRGRHRVNGPFRFAYIDLFTFGGGRIRRVDSYVVVLF